MLETRKKSGLVVGNSSGSKTFRPLFRLLGLSLAFTLAAAADTVCLLDFGPAGQGGDDTNVFQTAIDATAASGDILEVPVSDQPYNVGPLNFPSNAQLLLDPGAVVQARSGYSSNQRMLNIYGVSNVSISGTPGQSIFQMLKSEYTSGEYRHCLDIEQSNNVTISGIECNSSGGDGVYIGGGSTNVSISDSSFDNNRRQGMSITSANGVTVTNSSFTNTSGTAPSAGIDLEPNGPSDLLQNILIQDSSVSGNAGDGLMISIGELNYHSQPISITVDTVASSSNQGSGFVVRSEHDDGTAAAPGSITIQNSSSTSDAHYGAAALFYDASGASLLFQNMCVVDANSSRGTFDNAAIAVARGGGDSSAMGNVTFTGASIADTQGYLDAYFTVEDYSHSGLSNIHVGNFGTLSGLPEGTHLGILNEVPVDSVDIN